MNRALQARADSVAGLMESVQMVSEEITAMRTDDNFPTVLQRCQDLAHELNLEPRQLPRVTKPPARYTGPAQVQTTLRDFTTPSSLRLLTV